MGFGLAAAIATGGGIANADDTGAADTSPGSSASSDSGATARNDSGATAAADTPKAADSAAEPTSGADNAAADDDAADNAAAEDDDSDPSSVEASPTVEAPAEETPTAETPTAETPTESPTETPTEETSTPETPTAESPTEETPTEETPSAEAPTESVEPSESNAQPVNLDETDAKPAASVAEEVPSPTETSSAATTLDVISPTVTDIATSDAQTVTLDVAAATQAVTAAAVSPAIPAALANPLDLITTFFDNLLSLVGFNPSASSPDPSNPADSPLLWTVAAWVRRELFNIAPTAVYNPATNVLLDDGRVLGQVVLNDENGDPLTVVASPPARGTVVINNDGTFLYTPNAEFAANGGTDTFAITVSEASQPDGLSGLINALTFGLLGGPNTISSQVTVTAGPIDFAVPADGYGFGEGGNLVYLTDEELARELDAVVDAGGTWIRMPVRWSMIERQPGQLDWSSTDRIVAAAQARDLQVLATFVDAPDWARDGLYVSGPPKDMDQFALFAQLTVLRYGGYIDDWQVWNEPNLPAYYGFVENRPQNYTAMLKAVYPAIKAVQPNSTVVAAGMAREEGVDSPGVFLLQMYEAGAQGYFDAYAMHPYVFPGGIDSDPLNAWSDVERVHYAMTVFGDGDKKIWLTEVGAPTTCTYCSLLEPFIGSSAITVSEQEQAKQITDIFAAASELGYVGPIFIHGIRDQGIFPDFWADSNFGALLTNDWQPKYTAWILANANNTASAITT